MRAPDRIVAQANALLVQLRRLKSDGAAYRRHGLLWIEGEHLCAAARAKRIPVQRVLCTEASWGDTAMELLVHIGAPVSLVDDALFADISTLDCPAGFGYVLAVPEAPPLRSDVATVVLDRLQDPGNVGSILRSAAALGVVQIIALKGTVALWSPKVLRAGMGAHFALNLIEGVNDDDLSGLRVPLVGTSSHGGLPLHETLLPTPCAWVLGHEGQGVSAALASRCQQHVRIAQPGGEESLNVAAAAAICLYESARQRAAGQ